MSLFSRRTRCKTMMCQISWDNTFRIENSAHKNGGGAGVRKDREDEERILCEELDPVYVNPSATHVHLGMSMFSV